MPWLSEAMKDVISCDKLWGGANDLCRGCTHGCKQSFRAIIVLCPRYFSKRWKHREDTANGR